MIKRFSQVLSQKMLEDERLILFLCGIGRFSFRIPMEQVPDRAIDLGVLESAAIGMAAGISASGMIPCVYTWSAFLVERAYEQLKLDFGYQKLAGNFFGAGASYDLMEFGNSHYCPSDVNILKQIPNMQIVVPGNKEEFETLFNQSYANDLPTYYRLSEQAHQISSTEICFGKASVIKRGQQLTIVVVGYLLGNVMKAVSDLDVTVIYYSTVVPFDRETLYQNHQGNKVLVCEPYNKSGVLVDVSEALIGRFDSIDVIGVDVLFESNFGSYEENADVLGLDAYSIRKRIEQILEKK